MVSSLSAGDEHTNGKRGGVRAHVKFAFAGLEGDERSDGHGGSGSGSKDEKVKMSVWTVMCGIGAVELPESVIDGRCTALTQAR